MRRGRDGEEGRRQEQGGGGRRGRTAMWGSGQEGEEEREGGRQECTERRKRKTVRQQLPKKKKRAKGKKKRGATPRPQIGAMPATPARQHPRAQSAPLGDLVPRGHGSKGTTHRQPRQPRWEARTHRPPTLGEGVMEAEEEEEGSAGGRQVVGTRSREAEAQGGKPGTGAGGMGEGPHIAFSCSSVTYLGEGRAGGNTRG